MTHDDESLKLSLRGAGVIARAVLLSNDKKALEALPYLYNSLTALNVAITILKEHNLFDELETRMSRTECPDAKTRI